MPSFSFHLTLCKVYECCYKYISFIASSSGIVFHGIDNHVLLFYSPSDRQLGIHHLSTVINMSIILTQIRQFEGGYLQMDYFQKMWIRLGGPTRAILVDQG